MLFVPHVTCSPGHLWLQLQAGDAEHAKGTSSPACSVFSASGLSLKIKAHSTLQWLQPKTGNMGVTVSAQRTIFNLWEMMEGRRQMLQFPYFGWTMQKNIWYISRKFLQVQHLRVAWRVTMKTDHWFTFPHFLSHSPYSLTCFLWWHFKQYSKSFFRLCICELKLGQLPVELLLHRTKWNAHLITILLMLYQWILIHIINAY